MFKLKRIHAETQQPPFRLTEQYQELLSLLRLQPADALQRVVSAPLESWNLSFYLSSDTGTRCLVGHLGDYQEHPDGRRTIQLPGFETYEPAMMRFSSLAIHLGQRYDTHDLIVAIQDDARKLLQKAD
jgi:hypothetical protein